jgi:FkbM family methyltransferase
MGLASLSVDVSTASAQPAYRPISRFLPRRLRGLLGHPRIEPHVAAVLRGRVVRESARFALRELSGRRSRHVYRLRESGLRVLIAHGTPDAQALDQAFYQRAHEPSPGALAALQSIERPLRALDLGANVGLWGLWLHGRFPVEHLVGLEPDPENVERHTRQIEINGLQRNWEVLEAAAVTADGPVSFTVGLATNGHVTDRAAAGTVSVCGRDMFALLDGLDLLKIDIEGGEWPILADPRMAELSVPVVMLEYHADGTTSADPARDARRALERAGYATETTIQTGDGFGVLWGCKAPCASVST